MQSRSIQLLVLFMFTMFTVGTVLAADQDAPTNEPAMETPQEAPQLPGEPPAVPSPSAPEPPAFQETPAPAEAPPEAPADPCKGCACGGGMVPPACLECCR